MRVDVTKLNQVKGGTDFSYNDRAEDAVINALCYWYDLRSNGGTDGYDPRYDKQVHNTKIEIKISTSTQPYVEFSKVNGADSGIMTSTSDLYMFVNPGWDKGEKLFKARLIRTQELRHWIQHQSNLHPEEIITFEPDSTGPGSKGLRINFKQFDDLYVLGFNMANNINETFDTHTIRPLPTYALHNIDKFIR